MMTKHEMPPFNMIIESGRMVPATPYDAERLDSFRRGTKVKVRFTEEKDRVLVRKWFAIIGLVVKTCATPWKNKDEAHEAIKLALGIVNLSKTVGGDFMAYPKSLAELEDPELQDALRDMTELLSRMTGVDVETLNKETAHIVADPEEPHDPETGEVIENEASGEVSPASPADDDASGPADRDDRTSSNGEPVGEVTPVANDPAGSPVTDDQPALFDPDFHFVGDEIKFLVEFAQKAIRLAADQTQDEAYRRSQLRTMYEAYRDSEDVRFSADALKALKAMTVPIAKILDHKDPAIARDFIARDILGCRPDELEGRRHG